MKEFCVNVEISGEQKVDVALAFFKDFDVLASDSGSMRSAPSRWLLPRLAPA